MVELALQYGRYGYRRITALLQQEGCTVNLKRVERLWRREGVQVPRRQPKRKRLWLNGGSCVRLRSSCRNHVWSYDFMQARTRADVLECLSGLFVRRGVSIHLRSDNGTEFTAHAVRTWLTHLGSKNRDVHGRMGILSRSMANYVMKCSIGKSPIQYTKQKCLWNAGEIEYDYRRPHSAPGYRPHPPPRPLYHQIRSQDQ